MKKVDTKSIRSGTSQENRFLKALDFDYVKIDERSFEDLLVFAYGFSKLINFYNPQGQVDGDWSDFLNDETVILATIIDSNPTEIEIRFKNNLQKANLFLNKKKKLAYLQKCFDEIHGIAARFEAWLQKLKAVESFTNEEIGIRNEVINAVSSKLSGALRKLKAFDSLAEDKGALGTGMELDYSIFSNVWKLEEPIEEDFAVTGKTTVDKVKSITEVLDQVFQEFYETLLYLKIKAPEHLSQSLKSDKHYPEVALFLAFLKLFKIAQGDINNLNKRHLEFYYSQVLKQQPKPAVYDKAYLKFSLYDTAFSAEVKKGTEFLAGMDEEGNDIIYKADHNLIVNKAKIEKLNTIYINNNPLNIKGVKKDLYSNILSSRIPLEKQVTEDESQPRLKTFATFGENQETKGEEEKTMSTANIGFAISSPNLLLSEGDREISLTFHFTNDSFAKLQQYLKDIAYVSDADENETFIKIFMEAFRIDMSTDKGWHRVDNYVVKRNQSKSTLTLSFDIKSSGPAVVNFDKALHSGEFDHKAPVIRFVLNSDGYIYPFSLLKSLVLDRLVIDTNVKGMKNLMLHNNVGEINADNPFYPFGPIPGVGSYLLIGSNEIFQKSINDLKVNIEWYDLPRGNTGFKEYYDNYGLDIDNASFEVDLSVLDGGRWFPMQPSERQRFKLFRTTDDPLAEEPKPEGELHDKTFIDNVDIDIISRTPNYSKVNDSLTYNNMVQRGFIKLELTGPQFAFAHSVYPTVLSKMATKNIKRSFLKKKDPDEDEVPNPAYTPLIKSLSLDYGSSSVISFDRSKKNDDASSVGCLFHIHPFGECLTFPDNSKQSTLLLPEYDFEGSLIIGFSGLKPPQTVTMLFEMHDEFTVSSEEDPPLIEWSYLVNNEWVLLKPSRILNDQTQGFLRTGIISIELPSDLTNGNTILDPNLHWIRAVVYKNIDVASKLVSVTTQVLTATFDDVNNTAVKGHHLDQPLPAGSIRRSMNNIVGIQSVEQPLKSFNGLPEEKPQKFYTRIAERLRHKKRAITAWDYERLILQKFHEVYKVTCLPNMTSNNLDSPGSVLIVVTPYNTDMANPNEPMASSELLYKIKSYLQSFVSPFVKLEVRNPNFERLKIICSVKFKEGYNFGFYIQRLNDEIKRYISRSILDGDRSVDLGGRINTSDILSFMRTLPYVDFITKFSMIQTARDFGGRHMLLDTAKEGDPKPYLNATKPWSVLVSANVHQITVLNEKMEQQSRQAGINYLELGQDFIVE